jgi:hypothetical protein
MYEPSISVKVMFLLIYVLGSISSMLFQKGSENKITCDNGGVIYVVYI